MERLAVACILSIGLALQAQAGGKSLAVRETARYIAGKFGKQVGREGIEVLARRLEILVARYGEEVLMAVRKDGPAAVRAIEEAGTHGGSVVKLLARHGDEAMWVVAHPKRTAIFLQHGDAAAEAMLRHRLVAESLLEAFEQPAARALNAVQPRNARRLAILLEDGEPVLLRRPRDFLEVVGRHGDRAMDFVWKHKGALAVGSVLAAFLANPEPFLNGTRDLTGRVVDQVAAPLAAAPGEAVKEVVRRTDWTRVWLALLGAVAVLLGLRWSARRAKMLDRHPVPLQDGGGIATRPANPPSRGEVP